jgi:hypothetical protein
MQAKGLKLLQLHLKGLKKNQFELELFYKLKSNNSFARNKSILNGTSLTDKITDPLPPLIPSGPYLTSFLFRKKLGNKYLTYISACMPISSMLNNTSLTYLLLQKNNLWPFIRSTTNGFSVNCCPRSNPMCTNNPVLNKTANYGVQVYRYDPELSTLKSILTSGDFDSVSSMGYFIFSNESNEKILQARVFTFYNECISQRIMTGVSKPNCKDFLSVRTGQFSEDFDYAEEGVNNIGGSIGL